MEPARLTQRPPKRPNLGFLMSISTLLAKLSSTKRKIHKSKRPQNDAVVIHNHKNSNDVVLLPPKPPLIKKPKELLTQISNKAITLVHHHHKRRVGESDQWDTREEEDFGEGGVWQKAILMGDKCQPLDFSGVIYYDSSGKLLDGVPLRSPRASPLPSYLSRLPN